MHKGKNMRTILLVITLLISNMVNAEDKKYDICFVAGYFAGEDDKFMIGLSSQIMFDTGVYNDNLCTTAYQAALKIGEQLSTTGKVNSKSDFEIAEYASKFRRKVNNAITKLIEK